MKGWPDYTRVTGLVEDLDEFGDNAPIGIGEGAARLGAIKTFDPRGRVIFQEDFEAAVLHWENNSAGVGGSQALDTAYVRNGNQSCRLTTNTGAGRESSITRYVPQPALKQVGLEVSLCLPVLYGSFVVRLEVYRGGDSIHAAVRFNEALRRIEYYTSLFAWADTGFVYDETFQLGLFNTIKFVADFQHDEYIRLLYNYQELDMKGIPTAWLGWAIWPHMRICLDAVGDNTNNTACYVDDLILTTMEPQ